MKLWALFLVGLGICGGATTAPTSQPAMLQSLIDEGSSALSAGDAKAARDSFDDAVRVDASNAKAQLGLGISYAQLSLPTRALKYLQPLAMKKTIDRVIAIDYAAACVATKTPMPGVKVLRDFLTTAPPDERGATAMQIALSAADEHARQSNLYA
jgi:thioredoxin-like negative regulator of GroEL